MDILDEKVILDWAAKVSKKYVSKELSEEMHQKAEPFVKWLKEAEEEESDSESEDDDLEVSSWPTLFITNFFYDYCT